MSEVQTTEATESDAAESEQLDEFEQYPADHPLVKRLTALKETNKELREYKAKAAQLREFKAKAARLDELENAAKSDAEKAADRIAKAEAEALTVPSKVAEALKAHLVTLHEIDSEDAELFLTATEPDLLLKQVSRLLGQSGKRQKKNHSPREGNNPQSEPTSDLREFTRGLFGGTG